MRKKFLAMYALVGALVASPIFTSCIDGEESASVTAVRTAKAEQLKALTAIEQANAAYNEKIRAIDLESKQLDLESKQLDLDKKKAQVENDLLNLKLQILQNQAALDSYEDNILSGLTSDYTNALWKVTNLKKNIVQSNFDLTALQNGVISIQEAVTERVTEATENIAAYNATLEILKKTEGIDKAAIENKLLDLSNQILAAKNEEAALKAQYGETDYTDPNAADNAKLATIKAAVKLNNIYNDNKTTLGLENMITEDANGYLILDEGDVAIVKNYLYPNYPTYIKNLKAELGTDKDTETTETAEGSGVLTLYAKLAAANKALAAAEKVVADAGDAATDLQINDVKDKEVKVGDAKDAINNKLKEIAEYEKNNEDILAFDSYVAAFSGEDYEAYKAAKDALAAIDYSAQQAEMDVLLGTYFDNKGSVSSTTTYDYVYNETGYNYKAGLSQAEEIARLEGLVATEEAKLTNIAEKLELPNILDWVKYDDWNSQIFPTFEKEYTEAEVEVLIAIVEEEIAYYKTQLNFAQAEADKAKAALDAYIATSDDTTAEEAA